MRVLIVNTSEKTGGAAVAAGRLMEALNNNGVKAKMLVGDKQTDNIMVAGLPRPWLQRWNFLWERFCIFAHLHFSREHLFEIDMANAGTDITSLPEFSEADVVHLSWINQGMLSLGSIRKILRSGKPVVWTMHDLWPASAICHYARGCAAFKTGCHHCRLLPGGGSVNDLSARVYARKQKIYRNSNIHFVTCSKWLADQARQSRLLAGLYVEPIPNPIDTRVYAPRDRRECRSRLQLPVDKRVILFVSQRATMERKGMTYLVEAVRQLAESRPDMAADTVVAILGGHSEDVVAQLALPAFPLGYVSDERKIVDVYNAADVFVLPSLEDNLPNTIMEAMACGVPCVGFKVGGIPEMIDHRRNGYVAAFRDAADLAAGIRWVLGEADYADLQRQALSKVAASYSQRSVAMRYIEVYNQAMAFKDYSL
ncbi:glycosyltransferase [Prevotella dentalis DSM 3688]|uniref:Glycosyltransferase n=1 Tax=Prevotella dentalis (strain ATCC 49559 / DSM 3688 / JCM 13448 / NCTC 12043 / ES 2772) TaxID=908937 RepID=F9D2H7_PREDD|nr:glycosyltransferase family 4 protein [Prevotella dentalis]AGB28468.1 glycosyltransferase [Prevotella dentalis DSM 3688]EGQ15640.1 group 1 glycosyl transferase [Prevotella dentalis DSM 3688]